MPATTRRSRCGWSGSTLAQWIPSGSCKQLRMGGQRVDFIPTWRAAGAQCGLIDRRLDDGKLVCASQQIATNSTEGAGRSQTCNACRACHHLPRLSLPRPSCVLQAANEMAHAHDVMHRVLLSVPEPHLPGLCAPPPSQCSAACSVSAGCPCCFSLPLLLRPCAQLACV